MPLHVLEHPGPVAIVRLEAGEEPTWPLDAGPFSSITRTSSETSVWCRADAVPPGVRVEGPYTAFEVAGPLEMASVGLIAGLLEPLAAGKVSVLTMSTFDTDWVFVPQEQTPTATSAWRKAGYIVTPTVLGAKSAKPGADSSGEGVT